MTQIRLTPGRRLARAGLWLALVALPLLVYLVMTGGYVVAMGPLRGDAGDALLSFGWPVLLAGAGAALIRWLLGRMARYMGRTHQLPGLGVWWGPPVVVGVGAYLLGCAVQLVLPAALFHWYSFSPQYDYWQPLYWWPLPLPGEQVGYTIYPPLGNFPGYALIPPAEASCIKLGALLATLLRYRRHLRRPAPAAASAQSSQSA